MLLALRHCLVGLTPSVTSDTKSEAEVDAVNGRKLRWDAEIRLSPGGGISVIPLLCSINICKQGEGPPGGEDARIRDTETSYDRFPRAEFFHHVGRTRISPSCRLVTLRAC